MTRGFGLVVGAFGNCVLRMAILRDLGCTLADFDGKKN
jgi:hypothetical protein